MAPYRIVLHDEEGFVQAEHELEFEDDDCAIDYTGSIDHPHRIQVWKGERQVADFPPLTRRPGPPVTLH